MDLNAQGAVFLFDWPRVRRAATVAAAELHEQ